jgi:hypothetical protein
MEDDVQFPSGPWTGFYNYSGPEDRHRMDAHLIFARGGIAGEGSDNVGPFMIRGRYDATTKECQWTKTYIGRHSVLYQGCRDTHGIWGTWTIAPWAKGGFHIWPCAEGSGESVSKAAEADPPVETASPEPAEEVRRADILAPSRGDAGARAAPAGC